MALAYVLFGSLSLLFLDGLPYLGSPFLSLVTNIVAGTLPQGGSLTAAWSETWIYFLSPFLGASFGACIYVLLNHRLNKLRGIRNKEIR